MISHTMHGPINPVNAEQLVDSKAGPMKDQATGIQPIHAAATLPNYGLPMRERRLTVGRSQRLAMDAKSFLTLATSTLEQGIDVLSQLATATDFGGSGDALKNVELRSAQAEVDHLLDTLQAFASSVEVRSDQGAIGLFDGSCDFTSTSTAHASILDCRIFRVDLSRTGDKQIQVSVERVATPATVFIAENAFNEDGLASDVAIELRGPMGTETFAFATGTSAEQIAAMVNLFADKTGIHGLLRNGGVSLITATQGSAAQIGLSVVSEGNGGRFESNLSTVFATGEDAEGSINGIPAHACGNQLEISTATMDVSVTIAPNGTGDYAFTVTGGGVDLGLAEFASRVGISSLLPSHFATPLGRLYEIASGQRHALSRNPLRAFQIVCAALEYMSGLRERLLRQLRIVTISESLSDAKVSSSTPTQTAFDNSRTGQARPRFLQKRPEHDMGFSQSNRLPGRRSTASILVQPGASVLQVGSKMQAW